MPLYEFGCQACGLIVEHLCKRTSDSIECINCGSKATRIPSTYSIHTGENMGMKLRTRVALDDELKKQGISAPLFKSELGKDKARWLLKKEGIR